MPRSLQWPSRGRWSPLSHPTDQNPTLDLKASGTKLRSIDWFVLCELVPSHRVVGMAVPIGGRGRTDDQDNGTWGPPARFDLAGPSSGNLGRERDDVLMIEAGLAQQLTSNRSNSGSVIFKNLSLIVANPVEA